jgi:hypothetical protein
MILSLVQRNPWGGGEPLNVIISAQSSPDVLRKNGLIAFSRSLGELRSFALPLDVGLINSFIGLWNECANVHIGDPQEANLGDGKGEKNERAVQSPSTDCSVIFLRLGS